MRSLDFTVDLTLPAPGVDSAPNINEYQNLSGVKGDQHIRLDSLTTICEPII
jgi:hypothetical protein